MGNYIKNIIVLFLIIIQTSSVQHQPSFTGVIDRVEEGHAILLIEDKGRQIIIPVEKLPVNYQEGVWVRVYEGNDHVKVTLDHKRTKKHRDKSILFRKEIKRKSPTFIERVENRDKNE
ncbi:DUF3006 domain-containing protein [Pseudogracilibacillus sp. SO30301A]|uniref:DUF3006 domain-containing protein n=1 Tax=Pseudogracilibacillus sp. SO30301A TaxID=3098291 RepID=UPI00300DE0CF